MKRRLLAWLGLAVAASCGGAGAEIVPGDLRAMQPDDPPRRLVAPGPYRIECWQDGVKIVDEHGVYDLAVGADRLGDSIRFGRIGNGARSGFLSSRDDATCSVRRDR